MTKFIIGILGVLLFLGAVILHSRIQDGEKQAALLDDETHAYGMIDENAPPPCSWEVNTPEKVMSENKSQAVVVKTSNSADVGCEILLSLRAPSFDMSPTKEEQKVTLPKGGNGTISWIISPRKTGTYEMTISDILNTKVFGITVTNMFGLSALQAQVASIAGGLFGPMLTVPWWWDRLRGRKKKEEIQKEKKEE